MRHMHSLQLFIIVHPLLFSETGSRLALQRRGAALWLPCARDPRVAWGRGPRAQQLGERRREEHGIKEFTTRMNVNEMKFTVWLEF